MEAAAATVDFVLKYTCLLPFFAIATTLAIRISCRPGFCFMVPSNAYRNPFSTSSCSGCSPSWARVRPKIGRYRMPRQLPEIKAALEEMKQECAVCLCGMEDGCEVWELKCRHLFHKECLDRWVDDYRRVTCPLCRSPLAPSEDDKPAADAVELLQFEDVDDEESDSVISLVIYMGFSSWWLWW